MMKAVFQMICERCSTWFDITCEDDKIEVHKCPTCGYKNLPEGKKKPKKKSPS
jgi:DNA-directed RNA polymerase subunit RPC12/RpoP